MAHHTIIIWKNVIELADKVCKKYNLSYSKILPETRRMAKHYGECTPCDRCHNSSGIDERNCKEKLLFIRIHQASNPNKPLASSTILRTLAHELAHLREWNHGPAHRAFDKEIVEFMKEQGYF